VHDEIAFWRALSGVWRLRRFGQFGARWKRNDVDLDIQTESNLDLADATVKKRRNTISFGLESKTQV
jgi:hypothetical protein